MYDNMDKDNLNVLSSQYNSIVCKMFCPWDFVLMSICMCMKHFSPKIDNRGATKEWAPVGEKFFAGVDGIPPM